MTRLKVYPTKLVPDHDAAAAMLKLDEPVAFKGTYNSLKTLVVHIYHRDGVKVRMRKITSDSDYETVIGYALTLTDIPVKRRTKPSIEA